GGQDVTLPEDENEIAETECMTDKTFANYEMHIGYSKIDITKMSKPLGNSILVRDIIRELEQSMLRNVMNSVHYRRPINCNRDLVEAARSSLERIQDAYHQAIERLDEAVKVEIDEKVVTTIDDNVKLFESHMDADFNTANAITAWHELTGNLNKYLRQPSTSSVVLQKFIDVFDSYSDILGVTLNRQEVLLDEEIEKLIEEREA